MNLQRRRVACGVLLWTLCAPALVAWAPPSGRGTPSGRWRRQETAPGPRRGAATGTRRAALPEPAERRAYPQQTPHAGRHFRPSHPQQRRAGAARRLRPRSRRRFMEGWYYRLTLPACDGDAGNGTSFVFVASVEDPGNVRSDLRLACLQVIGPDDGYLVQADRDETKFWAWRHQPAFGCAFALREPSSPQHTAAAAVAARTPDAFVREVESGFQFLPDRAMGLVRGHDGSRGGVLDGQGVPGTCRFDFTIQPVCGWGDHRPGRDGAPAVSDRRSTGGWLSNFAVFEPHWQVTLADARATGSVTWKNQTYSFADAPLYAEKNWGAALPSKWYWTQCNAFPGYDQLSVTAGGGVRKIPFGRREALGMVSIHYNGTFFEGTPWTGNMDWSVAPWGSWQLRGYGTGRHPFEAEVNYTCDPNKTPGLVFRAPTPDEGMVLFCRATFEANCSLSLWELEWNRHEKRYVRTAGPPLIDRATSTQGGAEVGGGPWWAEWKGESRLKQPIRGLLRLPVRLAKLQRRLRRRQ